MARTQIGDNIISLKCVQNGKIYECVVKDPITLTRSKNAPSKLTCEILRDPDFTVEVGNVLALTVDNYHNQFYGYVITTKKYKEWCTVEAYDQLYYMNRSNDFFIYKDKTAKDIAQDIVYTFEYGMVDYETMEDTGYILPTKVYQNMSHLEIIRDALEVTKKNTGRSFYIWDDYGSIELTSEEWMAGETTCFITMGYLESYEYTETMENGYTCALVVKVTHDYEEPEEEPVEEGDEGDVEPEEPEEEPPKTPEQIAEEEAERTKVLEHATDINDELFERYGALQYYAEAGEDENVEEVLKQAMDTMMGPDYEITLTGVQGDMTVRGGTPVLVDFFTQDRTEFLRGWVSVDEVTHTFSNRHHTMDITGKFIRRIEDWDNTDPSFYSFPDNIY